MISYCVFPRKVVVTMPSKVQTKNRDLFNLLQAKPLKFNPKTFEEDHTPFCLSTHKIWPIGQIIKNLKFSNDGMYARVNLPHNKVIHLN
jgi:hypothetical protein